MLSRPAASQGASSYVEDLDLRSEQAFSPLAGNEKSGSHSSQQSLHR
jgi:hypothetical protein